MWHRLISPTYRLVIVWKFFWNFSLFDDRLILIFHLVKCTYRVCTWIVIGHSQFTLWSLNSPEWPQRYNKYRTNLIFLINTTNYATLFFMQGIKGLCPSWMGHKIRAEKTWSVTYNTNLNLVRKRYQYISSIRYETITQNTYSRSCSSSSCAQSTKEDIFVLKMFTNCFSA